MTTYTDVAAPGAGSAPEPVSTARVDWAPVPRVNLLPPEIVQARSLARLKTVLGGVLVVVLASCAGGVAWAQSGVASAQAELDASQARTAILRAEQAKYAQVPRILGLIDSAAAAREQAMKQDVLWYGFLSDLSMTTPSGVQLESLEMTLDVGTSTPPAPDPLTPAGMGQVTFSGKAQHFPDVASWLEAVGTMHGLDGSSLQTATRDPGTGGGKTGQGITFTSTIQVTNKALTHRYDRKAD
ncbi:MAG: PilN domain-containing protein [Kineosporiaceae bacterium]